MANNDPHKEGTLATILEEQTAKIPSDVYLWTAAGAFALATGLLIANKKHAGLYIGQWVPSLLIIGLYNKLVKVEGHDKEDKMQKEQTRKRTPATNLP